MKVSVFLLCYNESILISHTIRHYQTYLPGCEITIYDNESTDNSMEIARLMGCNIISWASDDIDEHKYIGIKNNCWKRVMDGWIIVCDMDEWLCVTLDDLKEEENKKTCILTIKGNNMIGESIQIDLNDIDLHSIEKKVYYPPENKNLCFYRKAVNEMGYKIGAHKSNPELYNNAYTRLSESMYSKKVYENKHMNYLGIPFLIEKMKHRYDRSARMRQRGWAIHYTNDVNKITEDYYHNLNSASLP